VEELDIAERQKLIDEATSVSVCGLSESVGGLLLFILLLNLNLMTTYFLHCGQ